MPALSPKRDHFARLVAADVAIPDAYVRAGYSADASNAGKLAKRPDVAARVGELRAAALSAEGVDENKIVAGLAAAAFSDPRSFFTWGPDGVVIKASALLTDEQAQAVVQVEMTVNPRGEKTIKVRLADRLRALETLGRYAGLERPPLEQHLHLHEATTESPREMIAARIEELADRLGSRNAPPTLEL